MNEGLEALKEIKNYEVSYPNPTDKPFMVTPDDPDKNRTVTTIGEIFDFDIPLIEKELKEGEANKHLLDMLLEAISYCYSKTDGSYGNLALPVVDKVKYIQKVLYEHLPTETPKDKKDKALEIIKNKAVNVGYILISKNVEEYNKLVNGSIAKRDRQLTQEEYDFLKEVLL